MQRSLSPRIVQQVDSAVEILRRGGIVAFPTDTVYGLGADVFNNEAVDRIYRVKQRSRNLSLPVLLAEATQVSVVAEAVPEIAWLLMERFWPGGLTLVLPKAALFPSNVTGGSDKVAVRIPNHIVPLTIIRKLGVPIIGTSANISHKPSPVTAQEVEEQLAGYVDFIVDGGRCPGGVESTVVDVAGEAFVVLRQGIIPESVLRKVVCQECEKEAGENACCLGL